MEKLRNKIIALRRKSDPFLCDVLQDLDWHEHIDVQGAKPWVSCRDGKGNLYTVFPEYDEDTKKPRNDVFRVLKE